MSFSVRMRSMRRPLRSRQRSSTLVYALDSALSSSTCAPGADMGKHAHSLLARVGTWPCVCQPRQCTRRPALLRSRGCCSLPAGQQRSQRPR